MIVDPDFFDHWRTRMVTDMLSDPMAPIYIMRLWAHCQNRKGDVFDIPTAGIKAMCNFNGDAQALEDALIAAEYMSRDGKTVTVIGWAEKNASLLSAWANGVKGGRPKKNQDGTRSEPIDNPSITHGFPMGSPSLTETKPIRVDKRREEENPQTPKGADMGRFAEFWECWPKNDRKQDKAKCAQKWKADNLDSVADVILADVVAKKQSRKWIEGYAECPLVYLRGSRWSDSDGEYPQLEWKSPEYFDFHSKQRWWSQAGFETVYEATNAGCSHKNFHEFREGRKEIAA